MKTMSKFCKSQVTPQQQNFILHNWRSLARPDQIAPLDDDWMIWLVLGGRGSGKTRTGAE